VGYFLAKIKLKVCLVELLSTPREASRAFFLEPQTEEEEEE
jgi:hypothetical protein